MENIIQLNQEVIKHQLNELVWNSVEETLNNLLEEEAKRLANRDQEDLNSAKEKAKAVARKLREMKLAQAAEKVETGIEETLTYMNFPREHWIKIRTNNGLERIMREIRRRTKVVGCLPDGKSALMLVCARLRHITTTNWGTKRYMNMGLLASEEEVAAIGWIRPPASRWPDNWAKGVKS